MDAIAVLLSLGLLFGVSLTAVKLYYRCSWQEAFERMKAELSSKPKLHVADDNVFWEHMYVNVKVLINEKQYDKLLELRKQQKAINAVGVLKNGLNAIDLVLPVTEAEKNQLEIAASEVLKRFLDIYDYPINVRTSWHKHTELGFPILRLTYTEDAKNKLLEGYAKLDLQKVVAGVKAEVKDLEDAELNE